MGDQVSLFDDDDDDDRFDRPEDVEAARADGISRAEEHADAAWKATAYLAVLGCAATFPDGFTADEVWASIEAKGDVSTHEPAALGPVFLRASRAGVIVKTGGQRRSRFARRHRDLTVWRRVDD